jgi:hypothetical protein
VYEVTLDREIKKLDQRAAELKKKSGVKLRKFITSKSFMINGIRFLDLLGDFGDEVITLVDVIQTPIPGVPPYEAKAVPEEEMEVSEREEAFSWPKGLVVAVAVAVCGALVYNQVLPPIVLTAAVFISIGLMFMPQIRSVVEGLIRREEEKAEESKSMRLEDWITDSLAKMRDLYTGADLLTMFQSQTKESLPDYGLPGMNETLYNRRKYFEKTLRPDFLSRINKIIVACDKNEWVRRSMIANAIVQAQTASAKVT